MNTKKNAKLQLGAYGESLAVSYLKEQGYRLIETNWHCERGEIDIIAHRQDVYVFIEVRTRRSPNTEQSLASITPAKQEKLIASVNLYLHEKALDHAEWRVDVIAIALPRSGQPLIKHVEDALGW